MFYDTFRFKHERDGLFFIIRLGGGISGNIILHIGNKGLFECAAATHADKLFRCVAGKDAPHAHKGDPVAAIGLIHVMGGHEDGYAILSGEVYEELPEVVSGHRIDA